MGAPVPKVEQAGEPAAESLLTAFGNLDPTERRRHASVLNYWLTIRGDKDFPPIRDLDPLELSDAAPTSLLLELTDGGADADIRHIGEALKAHGAVLKVSEAARASLLSAIASKLGIVAISRNFLTFEDEIDCEGSRQRAWITLLPFGSTGAWVDFVYGFVTLDAVAAEQPAPEVAVEPDPAVTAEPILEPLPEEPQLVQTPPEAVEEVAEELQPEPKSVTEPEPEPEVEPEPQPEVVADDELILDEQAERKPGFSKLLDTLAGATGFYSTHARVEPNLPPLELIEEPQPAVEPQSPAPEPEPVEALAAEPELEPEPKPAPALAAEQITSALEGSLHSKLTEVRAKADEARQAQLRAEAALHEGLGAAYDFALDAESAPEEYLKLVEAQGLKIQLRAPMKPVVKLAFDGLTDEATIGELEAVLAWALKQELPRGTLVDKIREAGGIAPLLKAA